MEPTDGQRPQAAEDDDAGDDAAKTPPLQLPGRELLRALAIVLAFTFAGSMLLVVRTDPGDSSFAWWAQELGAFALVAGFAAGLVVAAADYLRRRQR